MKTLQTMLILGASASLLLTMTVCANTVTPDGLMIEFLQGEKIANVIDPAPDFGWIVPSNEKNVMQSAYRVLVASDAQVLAENSGNLWDSGRVQSDQSINVPYGGKTLESGQSAFWKVKTWTTKGEESDWSTPQGFTIGPPAENHTATRYPLSQTEIAPVSITRRSQTKYLIDFGKVAFGYLRLDLPSREDNHTITIHFGEKGDDKGIDRDPGGTIRYYKVEQTLNKGDNKIDIHPPKDRRNTAGNAIRIPDEIGIIAPFRYIEIEDCPVKLEESMIQQISVHYPFEETASSFESDNDLLNRIWDLCKYSMKATSFCGIYVDGDRERIPYEADAYINQLSHYAVDREFSLARYSHEYLLKHSTWPTEWKQHSVMMAWADWMYTGNIESLQKNYDILKSRKTLENRARADGLLKTDGPKNRDDIVDWPEGERDGYDRREINTVINSFYYLNLNQMSDMAMALGKDHEAAAYQQKAVTVKARFNEVLFDDYVYIDGEGSKHSALHANMLPLAVGLVPEEHIKSVADFVISRDMACSVYGAQYLLEALYEAGEAQAALDLMISKEKRSWYNMIDVGSTITLEAWDNKFKPNQDWNHAWGAAPGNIISRYLLGVRPLEPGFKKALIQPQPASLKNVKGVVPTIRGPITVIIKNNSRTFALGVDIPANMTAKVGVPRINKSSGTVLLDGQLVEAEAVGEFLFIDNVGSGQHMIVVP